MPSFITSLALASLALTCLGARRNLDLKKLAEDYKDEDDDAAWATLGAKKKNPKKKYVVGGSVQDELTAWGEARGANLSNVVIGNFGARGRGLGARDPARYSGQRIGDDLLFSIPGDLVWTSRAAAESTALRATLRTEELRHDGFTLPGGIAFGSSVDSLAVHVAFERMRGNASGWAPYLNILPVPASPSYALAAAAIGGGLDQRSFGGEDRPASGGEGVVGAILAAKAVRSAFAPSRFASGAIEALAQERVDITNAVAHAFTSKRRLKVEGQPTHYDVLSVRRAVLWAWFTVVARSIDTTLVNQEGHSALFPFWDLVNHGPPRSGPGTCALCFFKEVKDEGRQAGGAVRLEYRLSGRPLHAGGEVLHDYGFRGGLCPLEWLLNFGFVDQDLTRAALDPALDSEDTGAARCAGSGGGGTPGECAGRSLPPREPEPFAGCAEVAFEGRRWRLPEDKAELLASVSVPRTSAADEAPGTSRATSRAASRAARLARGLLARADELPENSHLRSQALEAAKAGDSLAHDAAVLMLLERKALLGTARELSSLPPT